MITGIHRIIILSGQRGIGKSTVCRHVAEAARERGVRCGGFLTYKSADSGIIIEDIASGRTKNFASRAPEFTGPRAGQYYFNPEGLGFGLDVLERGLSKDLLIIDELGHLEARGEGFASAFDYLERDSFGHAIVVIREELLVVLLPRFKVSTEIVHVTQKNRDTLAGEILTRLMLSTS